MRRFLLALLFACSKDETTTCPQKVTDERRVSGSLTFVATSAQPERKENFDVALTYVSGGFLSGTEIRYEFTIDHPPARTRAGWRRTASSMRPPTTVAATTAPRRSTTTST